ncbi:hypothetical protein CDD80_6635 [Ophiocordyceps camponoti-rufipedis]|uniref:Zn(2)-C6 fungal-type domain-containing protein n=1 Tax=Ophiocordyceps camponoti-rufipedis TaxID=2004952 RepID=A0A2C5ZFD4_9HYPO|nr:hypothetical protein CDD80_6635 [Ophiocordyceps camponoti-rufipedis]
MAPSVSRASLPKGKPVLSSSSAPSSADASPPVAGPVCKQSRQAADPSGHKRRCISTACIACRKRKSKCDGALPSCAACASVYGTECIYDPSSDHRRKGVYRERADNIKARSSTLQIIVEAILGATEDDVDDVVKRIRASDNLDDFAQRIVDTNSRTVTPDQSDDDDEAVAFTSLQGETELARKMGELRLVNGSIRFIGGTSHLIYLADPTDEPYADSYLRQQPHDLNPVTSWTRVTTDVALVIHLIEVYFNYHYAYFTTLSKKLFWRDFSQGAYGVGRGATAHCSPLLVNAILAIGCHFTDVAGAYATPGVSGTKGDHFFEEAERLLHANEEFAKPRLATVQALALMSVREAGCARESKGWGYSGMSFRMAQDLGLNLEIHGASSQLMSDEEIDARKITFWGCFFFDKCWSNYMGRLPQLPRSSSNVSKFDVFPDEDAATWSPITDKGRSLSYQQPWRTRAAALLLSSLSEISSDLLIFFYHPNHIGRSRGKTAELKMLSEIHQRLEEWHRQLPKEFEPREGQLPHVTLIHMFYHLQYIHLFRPFLKYSASSSPLPTHVSPRRICTTHAGDISKLMRQYKKIYNLRQICNIAVYMSHVACTIHLLNLPDKSARRDITHGVKHLEEMAEDWPCARRTLSILSVLARKWRKEIPEDAASVLKRTDEKYGYFNTSEVPSPESSSRTSPTHSDDDSMVPPWTESSPSGQHPQSAEASLFPPSMAGIENHVAVMPPLQCHAQLPFDAGRMDFRTDMLDGWTRQAQSAPEPSYDSSLVPVGGCAMPPPSNGQSGGRQVSPEQGMGFNSQNWILNDSARWHHNFEGWEVGTTSSVFTFGQGNGANNMMQTSQDGNEQSRVHLNGLATMDDKGWMPVLE